MEPIQPNGINTKKRERKLRSGVYRQASLNQKSLKTNRS